jgi:hypothetical protein
MPNLLHQFLKVANDDWPKVLLGLVVPACQYGWKTWKENHVESKKKTLQQRIATLAQQRIAPFDDNPAAARLKQDLDTEYVAALKEYDALCHAQSQQAPAMALAMAASADVTSSVSSTISSLDAATAVAKDKHWVRRWLLLYAPKRAIAWIPHTLFFISLTITIFAPIGIFTDMDSSEVWVGLFGVAFYLVLTIAFRAWAVRLNRGAVESHGPAQHPRLWVATLIITMALVFEFFFLLGMTLDDSDEINYTTFQSNLSQILGGSAFFLAVALIAWLWRRRIARHV